MTPARRPRWTAAARASVRVCAATIAVVALAPGRAWADARVTFLLDGQPELGQTFRLVVSVQVTNESEVEIRPLDFGGLDVLSDRGPPQLPQMFGGFGGFGGFGQMTLQTQQDYLLMARRPGHYVIRGGEVRSRRTGRVVGRAQPVEFDVADRGGFAGGKPPAGVPTVSDEDAGLDPDAALASKPRDPDEPPEGPLTGATPSRYGFVRVAVDPPSPYLGQQATLRVWVYAPEAEIGCPISQEPTLAGFWNESLLQPSDRECAVRWFGQSVGGQTMAVGLTRRIAIFPTQTGNLTVGPVTMDIVRGGGIFGMGQRNETRSPPVTVTVREPPLQGRPADYVPGTVGPATLAVEADRLEIPVGETLTLTFRATSEGSLASARIEPPQTIDGLRVRVGDARVARDLSTGRVSTTLTREVLIVAERPGSYDMGDVRLPYFDPNTERYEVATARVPVFRATGSVAASPNAAVREHEPLDDLRPLRAEPHIEPAPRPWTSAQGSLAALAFGPVTVLLALAGRRLRTALRSRRDARAERQKLDPRALLTAARARLAEDPAGALTLAARALDRLDVEVPVGDAPAVARREARASLHAARYGSDGAPPSVLLDHVDAALREAGR